ncbi:MAG: WhiB family transcriptional regulator [Actinobacteria bacterium]|nr:WhiB family transcriptional regulator [Actinomycetota bacterium]
MFGTPFIGANGAPARPGLRLAHSRAGDEGATWRRAAACKGLDPGLFHPDDDVPGFAETVEAAKVVCDACPVRPTCLEHALAVREPDGIWGGLTAQERRRVLRRRRRSA